MHMIDSTAEPVTLNTRSASLEDVQKAMVDEDEKLEVETHENWGQGTGYDEL